MKTLRRRPFIRPHLLLTGRPGVGKTTLIHRVVHELGTQASLSSLGRPLKVGGFYTQEIRTHGRRVGFEVVCIPQGKRGILARVDVPTPFRIGKYYVDIPGFESLVLPLFRLQNLDLLIINEIGPMELLSTRFQQAVQTALGQTSPKILGTIQRKRISLVTQWGVSDQVTVVELSWGAWEETFEQVMAWLRSAFSESDR